MQKKAKVTGYGPIRLPKVTLESRINRLPRWARSYIHDIQTNADPAGNIMELADLRWQRDALANLVVELQREVKNLRKRTTLRRH